MSQPPTEFQPASQDALAKFLMDNATGARCRLNPIGGGTVASANAANDVINIRLDQLNRVIDYPARDMTITVEAGVRMSELSRMLAAEKQRLPIDVPQADQATLGGVIATNWSGSRRFGHGTMRDYVIGISAIDASGSEFKAGGRVVKNVAGYDLCKLLVGSAGALAIITQVTLKLRPIPEASALVRLTFDSLKQTDALLERLLTSATRPIVLDVLASPNANPQLIVGYEGANREVEWQVETLQSEARPFEPRAIEPLLGDAAGPLWSELRDFVLSPKHVTFKASFPASRTIEFIDLATSSPFAIQAHAGNGIAIGKGSGDVKRLSEFAAAAGGHLKILNASNDVKNSDAGSDSHATSLAWSEQLKRQLDPHNLLNPVP